jgi:serine/threonine protein kinase
MRGADARLIAETNQVWKPRLVLFNELQRPMKELGAGEFCRAYLSKLDGKDVVVKMLKPEQRNNPTAVKDLLSEGALMMAMQHPNVLGAVAHGLDDYGLPFVVIEMLATVLSAELPKLDDSVPIWTRQAQVKKWPLTRALRTGLELAEALHYCHTEVATSVFPGCRILHRDLKPNNIGFLPDGRLALFDFGLAKLWRISADDLDGNETRPFTGNTGSLRYMAPEVALSKPYSHKAEVFAFATLMWEMAAHERPFADCDVNGFYRCMRHPLEPPGAPHACCRAAVVTDANSLPSPIPPPPHNSPSPTPSPPRSVVLRRVCTQGERPKIPQKFPPQLTDLLTRCWSTEHTARPEMAEIAAILRELLAQLPQVDSKEGGCGCAIL